ncbi:hypothetical protein SAMN05428945_3384 [Streptomyces sp. 2224.1]|nr:hypothetical protein BX261_1942 [Streptomyces sp. 2321.6]SDR51689.1 hypothetical protein SAMN05216511_5272 [Streptomyces sp. KS_16]SEC41885.1 hypothetical protein SAMN05428940_1944 [Streptomyces sp. 2133.1]SEC61528.1 hypothetical protein SAMN05428945_3384 [Streptomyces sp. 2224.1]SEF02302.1 hypothetical protein SAMN05428954_5330 [Streptomyces sp. 2112.3]SNC67324.1 hypothetical protein SAMN06272741_1941 [Streptomyces sp. 2114.4]
MQEQGKTAAWCGRLLLFTAVPAALATPVRTPGHPGPGAPAGWREPGRCPAARTGPPRGRWPISGPPRPPLPA